MWALWCQTRGSMGLGSLGHLPEAGGIRDQHAPTMQALDVITEAMTWLDERFPRKAKAKGG